MRWFVESTLLLLFVLTNRSVCQRGKRYLVYPPPGDFAPTKVQLILGLGLPMEVDVSMIIGYVMKFNYVLPYNASYLTDSFVRYDRSIDRDDAAEENDRVDVLPTSNSLGHFCCMDLTPRRIRPVSQWKKALARLYEPSAVTSRWELYEILESALENSRYGKACLLRAICEAADVPFNEMNGLTGQLLRVLLAPSSTSDNIRTHADQEYHAAELAGLRNPGQCRNIFPECPESLLEYFTEIPE